MSGKVEQERKFDRLRQQAEALIAQWPYPAPRPSTDTLELIDELKIYQAELEIQNEELKRAHQELAELHHEYEALYEFAPCGYITLNSRGMVTHANLTAANLLKTERRLFSDSGFSKFIAPEWEDTFGDVLRKAGETGREQSLELPLKSGKGAILWSRMNIEADRDETGAVKQWRIVLVDITQRKAAEEERKKLEDRLIQSQKMDAISTLAGGIAHDFNNMLGVINGNISMALSMLDKGHELYELLSDVLEGARQAQHLTHQLLTFTRGGEPIKSIADVNQLLRETAGFVTRGTKSRCDFSLADDLSPVEVDAGQFHQAVSNIVINAIQAMPEGGIIQIKTENADIDSVESIPLPRGNYIRIGITDQGTGIPPENMSKIFNPFFTTKQKGNGLGLATTFSIIKRHHGYISVESGLKQGTVFNIYLPASAEGLLQTEHKKESSHQGHGKVLVMDDQLPILKMVGKMLGRMGYEVALATNGEQAIKAFREAHQSRNPYDLVILDLTVPGGVGGAEAITELVKIDPNVKAVVSSGYSTDPVMANYKQYGFCGVIPKPYTKAQMAELLNRVLGDDDS
jgi:signal transduction histidine kinase/CheY-like chemotaxis protein